MTLPDNITYRYLLEKAWPIVLANAAVPLLGLVDTAVIGNVGSVEDLGAIAFGALIFLSYLLSSAVREMAADIPISLKAAP